MQRLGARGHTCVGVDVILLLYDELNTFEHHEVIDIIGAIGRRLVMNGRALVEISTAAGVRRKAASSGLQLSSPSASADKCSVA